MRCTVLRVVLVIVRLRHADLLAQEIQLRAGTLLDCTLQEPSWHRLKAGRDLNNALAEFQRDSTIDPSFAVAAPEAKVVQS